MAKEKNKPVPVRFNLKLLEVLKEEEKIDTPQQALNFLTSFWENNRPAKGDFLQAGEGIQPSVTAAVTAPVAAAVAPAVAPSKKKTDQKKDGTSAEPPKGLSGIDLSIWKAEQKEKSKG